MFKYEIIFLSGACKIISKNMLQSFVSSNKADIFCYRKVLV